MSKGVGFRAWVCHHAELNGLEGWVRNRRDGAVEALLSGPDDLVDAMLKACRQGPAGSHVQSVDVLPDPSAPDPRSRGRSVRGAPDGLKVTA